MVGLQTGPFCLEESVPSVPNFLLQQCPMVMLQAGLNRSISTLRLRGKKIIEVTVCINNKTIKTKSWMEMHSLAIVKNTVFNYYNKYKNLKAKSVRKTLLKNYNIKENLTYHWIPDQQWERSF